MQAGVQTAADPSAGLVWLPHEIRPHPRACPCVCGGTRSQGSGAETTRHLDFLIWKEEHQAHCVA